MKVIKSSIVSFSLLVIIISSSIYSQDISTDTPKFEIWPTYLSKTKIGVNNFIIFFQPDSSETDSAFLKIKAEPPLELLGVENRIIRRNKKGSCEILIETTNYGQDTSHLWIEILYEDYTITDTISMIHDGFSTLFFSRLFDIGAPPHRHTAQEKKWEFYIKAKEPLAYNYVNNLLDNLEATDKEGVFKSVVNHWQRKKLLLSGIPIELVRDKKPQETNAEKLKGD